MGLFSWVSPVRDMYLVVVYRLKCTKSCRANRILLLSGLINSLLSEFPIFLILVLLIYCFSLAFLKAFLSIITQSEQTCSYLGALHFSPEPPVNHT